MLKIIDLENGQLPFSEARLKAWLIIAAPGEAISYYRGSLCNDRGILSASRKSPIGAAADIMLAASEAGLVSILQIRKGESDYLYIAKRTNVPFRQLELERCRDGIDNRRNENAKTEFSKKRRIERQKEKRQMEAAKGAMA